MTSYFTSWLGGSSSGSGPPTPKRNSTLNLKPPHRDRDPLPPKLTTPITEYPPAHSLNLNLNTATDAQWEHVKGCSPPSPETDEMTFEALGFSQVDGVQPGVGVVVQGMGAGAVVQTQAQAQAQAHVQTIGKEEGEQRLRQQLETSLATHRTGRGEQDRERERERERLDRKLAEMKANGRSERDRERDSLSSGSRLRRERERERDKERDKERDRDRDRDRDRERDQVRDRDATVHISIADTLKEENDKLKAMIQQQVQQLNQAQEDLERQRAQMVAEAERLRGELIASDGAHKDEMEKWKKSVHEHAQRIEHLSNDRERVRRDRDSVTIKLNAEVERLKQVHAKETAETNAAIEQVNRDHAQARSDLRKVKKSLDDCAPQLDLSLREIERLHHELSNAKDAARQASELKRCLDIQTKDLDTARNESSALKKEFGQVMTLLEDRTSELKGAQSFLTTADNFSGAEVTNTLQRLNTEVLQSTAFMAESMVEAFFPDKAARGSQKTEDQVAGSRRASTVIGGVIVHFLRTKNHKDDPILVQIAFQAYLAYHLRWIACAWIIGGDEDHNRFIETMYQSVREKEAQAIAGRWRALTRANVPNTQFDQHQLTLQIATKMVSGLCDILLAAGCTGSKSDITAALSAKFTEKLSLLVSLAIRVNKIVGEDVTSGELEVLAVPPATTFDATWMEDSYEDGSSSSSDKTDEPSLPKVLCATDVGLRKKTRVAMTGEKEKQWEIKVLLKPKVALESVIEILDDD